MAGPVPGKKKNRAFGIISARLRQFYSELEGMVDPNTDDFFQRVMRQSEERHSQSIAGKPGRMPSPVS